MDLSMIRGDTAPALKVAFRTASGVAPLTNAASVVFVWRTSTTLEQRAMTITDAARGTARYDWQPGDTNVAGSFPAAFVVTYNDDRKVTIPNGADKLFFHVRPPP